MEGLLQFQIRHSLLVVSEGHKKTLCTWAEHQADISRTPATQVAHLTAGIKAIMHKHLLKSLRNLTKKENVKSIFSLYINII